MRSPTRPSQWQAALSTGRQLAVGSVNPIQRMLPHIFELGLPLVVPTIERARVKTSPNQLYNAHSNGAALANYSAVSLEASGPALYSRGLRGAGLACYAAATGCMRGRGEVQAKGGSNGGGIEGREEDQLSQADCIQFHALRALVLGPGALMRRLQPQLRESYVGNRAHFDALMGPGPTSVTAASGAASVGSAQIIRAQSRSSGNSGDSEPDSEPHLAMSLRDRIGSLLTSLDAIRSSINAAASAAASSDGGGASIDASQHRALRAASPPLSPSPARPVYGAAVHLRVQFDFVERGRAAELNTNYSAKVERWLQEPSTRSAWRRLGKQLGGDGAGPGDSASERGAVFIASETGPVRASLSIAKHAVPKWLDQPPSMHSCMGHRFRSGKSSGTHLVSNRAVCLCP